MILKNIKALCSKHGISISCLEKQLGFGNATIRGWEKSSPSVEKLKKVADYFGVSIDQLIEEEPMTPEMVGDSAGDYASQPLLESAT